MPKDGENPVAVLDTKLVWELLARAGGQEQPHWEQVRGLRQGQAGKGIPGTSAPALHKESSTKHLQLLYFCKSGTIPLKPMAPH